jgi:indolepyruvate ferredoxin oxidoreductase alpha subunit
VLIEKIAEGCGVKYVRVVDPFKVSETETALKEALQNQGPSVLVFRAPCALVAVREKRSKGIRIEAYKITDKCTNCMACIRLLGCPALTVEEGKVNIDEALCTACGLCISVCPFKAIGGST